MPRTITTIDDGTSLTLPPEAVDALGVEAGAQLDVQLSAALWSFARSKKRSARAGSSMHSRAS